MGQLAVMGRQGDTKHIWDPANADETAAARKMFTDLRAKGFLAFEVSEKGDKDRQLTEFNAQAGKIIMAPPLRGGR